ncbi:hypothetical protein D3C81_1865210 [compost metagenome]
MAHANGEHQERHQHGERIEVVAEQRDQPQLPDHRDDRAAQHQQGAANAAGIGKDDRDGDTHRGQEEQHHLFQAADQVANQLGEADDVDVDLGILALAVALPDLLDGPRQALVVHGLALGVPGHQRDHDHA